MSMKTTLASRLFRTATDCSTIVALSGSAVGMSFMCRDSVAHPTMLLGPRYITLSASMTNEMLPCGGNTSNAMTVPAQIVFAKTPAKTISGTSSFSCAG